MSEDIFTTKNPRQNFPDAVDGLVKQASTDATAGGFHRVWGEFLKTAMFDGWKSAARQAALLDKNAGLNPAHQGMVKAAELIESLDRMPEVRGWYAFLKEANTQDDPVEFSKEAQKRLPPRGQHSRTDLGRAAASEATIRFEGDLNKIAWEGPSIMFLKEAGRPVFSERDAILEGLQEYEMSQTPDPHASTPNISRERNQSAISNDTVENVMRMDAQAQGAAQRHADVNKVLDPAQPVGQSPDGAPKSTEPNTYVQGAQQQQADIGTNTQREQQKSLNDHQAKRTAGPGGGSDSIGQPTPSGPGGQMSTTDSGGGQPNPKSGQTANGIRSRLKNRWNNTGAMGRGAAVAGAGIGLGALSYMGYQSLFGEDKVASLWSWEKKASIWSDKLERSRGNL